MSVDAIIVAHASRDTLRACVAPLAGHEDVRVIVVDTASADPAFDTVEDLAGVDLVHAERNGGFAYGCNLGAARGSGDHVLLLNPDAILTHAELSSLVSVLDGDASIGLVAPRIVDEDGVLQRSARRFPRLRSALSKALLLHRIWPNAEWSDDLIHDAKVYENAFDPDWVSGACMLIRRDAWDALGGLDEGFFMYAEDTDICWRLKQAGLRVHYTPAATAVHTGGHSAPRSQLRTADVRSHIRYIMLREGARRARLSSLAIALDELTHLAIRIHRPGYARGHLAGLHAALSAAASPSRCAALASRSPFA